MDDQLAELLFPLQGIDEAREFEEQRQGTTPVGVNVRAFEPLTQRARGGARPGLVEYVPARVNGAQAIQLLDAVCVTTDPAAMGGVVDGGSGQLIPPVPGSAQDPTATFGGLPSGGDGSGGFMGFQPVFNWNRPGGDSQAFAKKRKKKQLTYVQSTTSLSLFANLTASVAYTSNVAAGDLLVAAVVYRIGVGASTVVGVTDSVGTAFTKIAGLDLQDAGGFFYGLSLWYGIAGGSGADTVTWTVSAVAFTRASVLEYKGNTAAPLGGSATGSSGSAATALSTGSVPVVEQNDLVLAAFYPDDNFPSPTAGAGFTLREQNFIYVEDGNFNAATAGALTISPGSVYAAVGASFKHG